VWIAAGPVRGAGAGPPLLQGRDAPSEAVFERGDSGSFAAPFVRCPTLPPAGSVERPGNAGAAGAAFALSPARKTLKSHKARKIKNFRLFSWIFTDFRTNATRNGMSGR